MTTTDLIMDFYILNIWKSLSSIIYVTTHVYHVYCIYLYIMFIAPHIP